MTLTKKSNKKKSTTEKKKKNEEVSYFVRSELKNYVEIPFNVFINPDLPDEINKFNLTKKRTYCNKIDLIIEYDNDLLRTYDKVEDFLLAYLALKWRIDKKDYVNTTQKRKVKKLDGKKGKEEVEEYTIYAEKFFFDDLYNLIFTPHFVKYIEYWIDKNYTLNIDEKNKEKSKKFNPVLQFSDKHCKMLQCISLGMKLIIPIILHFSSMYNIMNMNSYLESAFDYLFELFSHEVDLHSKLWESVYSRVIVTKNSDKTFWNYVEIEGNSINKVTAGIYQKLIVDIIPKYEINQNLINLNHVVINNNIDYTFRSNIEINYKPLNLAESEDDVSDYDKISINTARIDEGINIINEVNIEKTIKKLIKNNDLKITKKELDYYLSHTKKNSLQENMLCNFFGKDLGNAESIYFCNKVQYITLLLIMKHILVKNGFTILSHICMGNIIEVNEKSTLGKKVLVDIINDPEYINLCSNKYSFTESMDVNNDKQSMILRLEANILNNKFFYNDYDDQSHEGEEIETSNKNLLKKEILDFTNLI